LDKRLAPVQEEKFTQGERQGNTSGEHYERLKEKVKLQSKLDKRPIIPSLQNGKK